MGRETVVAKPRARLNSSNNAGTWCKSVLQAALGAARKEAARITDEAWWRMVEATPCPEHSRLSEDADFCRRIGEAGADLLQQLYERSALPFDQL